MSPWPKLSKAPIVEALLDVQATLPPATDLAKLESLQQRLGERYPVKHRRHRSSLSFNVGSAGQSLPGTDKVDGYFFESADGRQIVQGRLDGFTFNRLNPYEGWAAFKLESQKTLALYCDVANPGVGVRLGLRFINRIELPVGVELRDYLRTAPELAPEIPQVLGSFFMRLVIPDAKTGAVAIVTEAMDPMPPGATIAPVQLDIDASLQRAFVVGSDDMWRLVESLRALKNEIFFRTLTKKAEETFR